MQPTDFSSTSYNLYLQNAINSEKQLNYADYIFL